MNASPRILTLEGHQEVLEEAPTAGRRGPKGARIGDVVVAEGTRSRVAELDPARHKAICQLFEGSHARRRFRAQSIVKVEGGAGP